MLKTIDICALSGVTFTKGEYSVAGHLPELTNPACSDKQAHLTVTVQKLPASDSWCVYLCVTLENWNEPVLPFAGPLSTGFEQQTQGDFGPFQILDYLLFSIG